MNNVDKEYFRLVNKILTEGEWKGNRTGVDCLTIAGFMFEHNMAEGFPLLTSRKLPFKSTKVELEFFIKGLTDKRWLQERGCGYWNGWATPIKVPYGNDIQSKMQMLEEPDLGPIYGYQWRNFGKTYQPIPHIKTSFNKIPTINNDFPDSYLGLSFDGKYGKFIVEKVILPAAKNKSARLQIMFLDTGYRSIVRKDCITKNKVKDYYFANINNVACLGRYDTSILDPEQLRNIMSTWKSMICRCYNKSNKNYKYYGGNGVYVCDRWLVFEYFLQDIATLENYSQKLNNIKEYTIDRININGEYSINNCKWSTKKEQAFNRRHRGTFSENVGIDQLKNVVDTLKKNPSDRRMICSAWNPSVLKTAALPSCHDGFRLTVINGKLNLAWTQRSVDTFLGLPANISSYGILLHLLAKESGLTEGKLIGFLWDVHLYSTHIEQTKELLTRSIYRLPTIKTDKFTSIFDWEYSDTELINYQSGPVLTAPVSI